MSYPVMPANAPAYVAQPAMVQPKKTNALAVVGTILAILGYVLAGMALILYANAIAIPESSGGGSGGGDPTGGMFGLLTMTLLMLGLAVIFAGSGRCLYRLGVKAAA